MTDDNKGGTSKAPPTQSSKFIVLIERGVVHIGLTLITSGVIALFVMAASVFRLDERVATWTRLYEKKFEESEVKLERLRDQINSEIRELRRDFMDRRNSPRLP